eukprot:scaffold175522_cov17-Cyclotella_meneghiniana.AAC.1
MFEVELQHLATDMLCDVEKLQEALQCQKSAWRWPKMRRQRRFWWGFYLQHPSPPASEEAQSNSSYLFVDNLSAPPRRPFVPSPPTSTTL